MPTWQQLNPWVQDPARTVQELQQAAVGLGLSPNGGVVQLRARITRHVTSQADQQAQAPWAPPNWEQPPAQPAQPQPVATPPATTPPQAQTPPVTPVATPPAQTVQQQPAAARRPLPNWVWPIILAAGIVAAAVIGLIFALRYDNGSNGATASSLSVSGSSGQSAQSPAGNKNGSNGAMPTQTGRKQVQEQQQPASADWASNKCAWLRTNFPQDTKTIQSLGAKSAGVDSKRIRPTRFRCNATTNDGVFDGYVVMGPNEGFLGTFTVSVPDHGRVDSYATSCGARYTVDPRPIAVGSPNKCDDTWAIDSGSVTALSATVYAFNDENPPNGGSSAQPGGKSTTDNGQGQCMLGKDLASQRGWTLVQPQPSSVTQYGGAQVEVKTQDNLPQGWEATTSGPALHGGDLLTPGFYSVYPPHGACRVSLGVQD